jgi:hypothetical protein
MPSSNPRARRLLSLLVLAALTVSVRLPFVLRADRFFDSDEAVEGLMARHVAQGEHPAFLWGQRYKGVPEVYLNAALFSVARPSVVALKATTLACFVLFVCLQFLLLEALFSTRIAWMASALVILCPPALVLWTLSANAEVVMTFLAGTVMGLALVRFERTSSRAALALACGAAGFGLWVHQYIVYYLLALAIGLVWTVPAARTRIRQVVAGDGLPAWLRIATAAVAAVAALYVALGLMAFLTGGFAVTLLDVYIGVQNPQKLWRIGAALLTLFVVVRLAAQLAHERHRGDWTLALAAVAGFVVGYAPALVASFGSVNLPMARMNASDLRNAAGSIVGEVVPIVAGLRGPSNDWILSPWLGLVPIAITLASFFALRRRSTTPFFHVLVLVVPVVFIASGSFHDSQSYRYVIPVYAALAVVFAIGAEEIGRWNTLAGAAALGFLLIMGAVEQATWYSRLPPETRSGPIMECLTQHGIRGAMADYWLSYKLTFLSGETLILAPSNGVDRYPPYTSFVRSLGPADDAAQPCRSLLLQ